MCLLNESLLSRTIPRYLSDCMSSGCVKAVVGGSVNTELSSSTCRCSLTCINLGNVQLNWPKLFQAFSVNFTLIFFHECVHSIIPHQHM